MEYEVEDVGYALPIIIPAESEWIAGPNIPAMIDIVNPHHVTRAPHVIV